MDCGSAGRGGSRILEMGACGEHNFKRGTHIGHILIITVDPQPLYRINFQLQLNAAWLSLKIDCIMNGSLNRVKFNITQHQKMQDKD